MAIAVTPFENDENYPPQNSYPWYHEKSDPIADIRPQESLPWSDPNSSPLEDIHRFMNRHRDEYTTFRDIFEPDIEKCTRVLEHTGFQIWFACEVNGTEYRLAARKEE